MFLWLSVWWLEIQLSELRYLVELELLGTLQHL